MDKSEELKGALLGLLPDNWRMWVIGIAVAWFLISNPTLLVSLVQKIWASVSTIIGSFRGVSVPSSSVASSGIETPMRAAQSQIEWAIQNGNAEVFANATATLKALLDKGVKGVAAAILVLCCVGCSAATNAPEECEYSHSHAFGYTPLTETDRAQIYQAEPTLSQQAPELFEQDK